MPTAPSKTERIIYSNRIELSSDVIDRVLQTASREGLLLQFNHINDFSDFGRVYRRRLVKDLVDLIIDRELARMGQADAGGLTLETLAEGAGI